MTRIQQFFRVIVGAALLGAVFVLGYVASGLIEDFLEARRKPVVQEVVLSPPPKPFYELLSYEIVDRFDQLYHQRKNELRQIIEAGAQNGIFPMPEGLAPQVQGIDESVQAIEEIPAQDGEQESMKRGLVRVFQLLKDAYAKEVDFLQGYATEGQNISFVTNSLFDINSKDQASGVQYVAFLKTYREKLGRTITQGKSAADTEAKVQKLILVNALIDKYETELDVEPEEEGRWPGDIGKK
jgi:hypothetical protein